MATATVDLTEFMVTPDEGGVSDKSLKYQFWKRGDNGWVTVAGGWPVEFQRVSRKGYVSLDKYGFFHQNPSNYQTIMVDKLREDPSFAIEFPVDQILEYGWHRKPPVPGLVFPQLEGVEHEDVVCGICKRPFLSDEDLARHESIAHRENASHNNMARALADALGRGGENGVVEAIKILAEGQQAQQQILAALAQTMQQLAEQATPKAGK